MLISGPAAEETRAPGFVLHQEVSLPWASEFERRLLVPLPSKMHIHTEDPA